MSVKNVRVYVGQQLREAREHKKLTQQQVAKAVDRDDNYYAKVERGDVTPSLTLLIQLADFLEVEYKVLFPKRSKK